MIKRFSLIFLSVALTFCLASCGGENVSDSLPVKTTLEKTVELVGSPETEPISSNPDCTIIRDKSTGVQIRYFEVEGVTAGEQVNIMHISDMHLNAINDKDIAENNPATMSSYENRSYCRDGESVPDTQAVLEYSKYFDAVVSTGDNIDYISYGSLDLLKANLFDKIENLLVCLGNHDFSRQTEGKVKDTESYETRLQILKQYWKHDLHYCSKVVKNRVMLIALDNGRGKYLSGQPEKLAADIEKAREKGLTVLIFQHIPLATRKESDKSLLPLIMHGMDTENFYNEQIGGVGRTLDEPTQKVYDLITKNADVIRGVFTGHLHLDFSLEIPATYEKDGGVIETVIPQAVIAQTFSANGHFLSIIVK